MTNRDKEGIIQHWDASYPLREVDATNNGYKNLVDIFEIWPILKESDQFTLVNCFMISVIIK